MLLANIQLAALRTAAGGNPSGRDGFNKFTDFLDTLGSYLMWVGAPVCVIGIIVGGVMLAIGDEDGTKWWARAAIGLAGVLCAKAITS